MSFTDWLGQPVSEGDTIVYAAGSGRSITMVIATVVKFNDSGTVTVKPLKSSRWEQHHAPVWYVDSGTGDKIANPYKTEHIVSDGYYLYPDGSKSDESYRWQCPDGTWNDASPWVWGVRTDTSLIRGTYQPTVFKEYVQKVTGEVKPVTLKVTENITKWTGGIPE